MEDLVDDQLWYERKVLWIGILSIIAVVGFWLFIESSGEGPSPGHSTRHLVHNARAIVDEYEAHTGKLLPGSFESPEASIRAFLDTVNQETATRTMVMNLGKDFLAVDAARNPIKIVDSWGRSLWYVLFNDGRVRGLPIVGTADVPGPFVASAGPDGKWGTYTNGQPDGDARDNIYSFDFAEQR